ncbi:MAG: pyrroline-5-carboxylate reductase, partial [Alphaproteobacteria bacterium HGW-Alphaproteobacteria-8]
MTDGLEPLARGGLALLGCGKMGGAMLEGWLAAGLPPASVHVIEPHPSAMTDAFAARGVRVGVAPPASAAAVVIAVKPQMMAEALGA